MSIDVVVGGLYGSEAKGHCTQRLVERRVAESRTVWNIRIGGPNAGHTGYDPEGNPWAFRQVPVGVLVPWEVGLEVGAGSEVDLPVLLDEIDRCLEAGLLGPNSGKRLVVHGEATLIGPGHKLAETGLVGKIGSTGKGIGAARAERLMRRVLRVCDSKEAIHNLSQRGVEVVSSDQGEWRESGSSVVIEGTQGYALGMHAGFYPSVTSGDCRAIDFLAQAGVNPWDHKHVGYEANDLKVWVVARVFPIRVAGNSGPMKNERSWEALGLPEERTTVTKLIRRVGLPDWDLVRKAVVANGGAPTVRVVLTMMDQLFNEVRDVPWSGQDERWSFAEEAIQKVEAEIGAPIEMVTSGPNTAAFREVS